MQGAETIGTEIRNGEIEPLTTLLCNRFRGVIVVVTYV